MKLHPIERRSGLDRKTFTEEYIKTNKPVIFTDLVKDWPATEKWTFDYFRKNHGHIEVPLYDDSFRNAGKSYLGSNKSMKFGDYLDIIEREPTKLRMFLFNIFKHVPELTRDFSMPEITEGWLNNFPMMFFGGESSKVELHYDLDCASVFLTQFQRKKKVILFAPDQSSYLYKFPFTVQSAVDVYKPDYKKYPAQQKAVGYEAIIDHGETIYMPSRYWHSMYYVEGGFSLSLRTHSLTTRTLGLLNISQHFVVDKGMNFILGNRWSNIKEQLAHRKAATVQT